MRARLLLAAPLVAVLAASACGQAQPPPIGGTTSGSSSSSTGGPTFGNEKPKIRCADIKLPDGGSCDCVEANLLSEAPNMYFVLDRSGSMDNDDKWTKVRVVVANVVRALGQRINVGVMLYPGFLEACAPGFETLSLRPGDAKRDDDKDGTTTLALIQAMDAKATGGTPTHATLDAVLSRLQGVKGKTFVVLATDGAPNCTKTPCGGEKCSLNIEQLLGCTTGGQNCCTGGDVLGCVDDDGTDLAVKNLKSAGIDTFVIGAPGSNPYAVLLDRLAKSGGTARPASPFYYRVDSASEADFTAALKKVAAKIVATCTFNLKAEADPSQVNVYLDDILVPKSDADGWKVDGKVVTLTGSACSRVLEGEVLDVRIVSGCPTVIR